MKRYDNYKCSGVEWIGKIPEHWSKTRIKYLALEDDTLFIDGDWIESDVIVESGIKYITTGNVGVGVYKEQGLGHIAQETFDALNCTEVFEGDLIISRLNVPIGRCCIVPNLNNRIVTSVDNVILRPNSKTDKRYLLHLFSSKEYFEHTELIARGATMQRISRGLFGKMSIPFPPLKEQIRIAKYLDQKTNQIDKLIADKQKLIELLNEERTAMINQAVTKGLKANVPKKYSGVEWIGEIPKHWKKTKLFHLTTKIGDGLHGTPEYVDESEFHFINGNNIGPNKIKITEQTKKVSIQEANKQTLNLGENTLLLSINGTIGNLSYYFGEKVMLGKSVAYINCNDEIFKSFLYYYLQSQVNSYYFSKELSGSTIKNLSLESIKNTPIVYPSKEEQNGIVEFIETENIKIGDLLLKIEEEIELLKEYKTALISEVVTGKVDVRSGVLENCNTEFISASA